MARFVFPLENVFRYRLNREESAKQDLARSQLKYRQQKKIVEELKAKIAFLEANSLASCPADLISSRVLNVSGIVHENIYRDYLLSRQQVEQKLLAACEEEVARCRERVLQARQERLILEKLKEKSWREYWRAERKKEQNLLDEIGRGIFVSRQRGD